MESRIRIMFPWVSGVNQATNVVACRDTKGESDDTQQKLIE
jgi:hypothetical protein